MSLGGASGYIQPGIDSMPLEQSYMPYLPYAQQGPYQAIMSQMGNYGGAAGTGYQQGIGSGLFGGSGAMGGFNPDLYKRAAVAAAPIVSDTQYRSNEFRGGGSSGRGDGGGYGGGFPSALAPYANTLASLLGDAGLNSASSAVSRALMSGAMSGTGAAPQSSPAPSTGAINSSEGGEYGGWGSRDAGGGNTGFSGSGAAAGSSTGPAAGTSNGGESGGWGSRDAGGGSWAKGGSVMASMLQGPNPMGPDQGYGALKSGEYVIKDSAVKKYGIELMDAINSGKISKGKLRGLLEM